MQACLTCITPACRVCFDINDVIYNCPKCGGLLEAKYDSIGIDAQALSEPGASVACATRPSIKAASGATGNCFRS